MKNFSLIIITAATVVFAASCTSGAAVRGTVTGVSDASLVAKLLDVNTYSIIDTVKTGKDGSFKFEVPVSEGDPEFVYLFYKDTKIASMLLEKGETVTVNADTLGHYSVKGSEGSEKLQFVESRFAGFLSEISGIEDPSEFVRRYISYYRESVKYVMQNPYSLTVIPVLYENIGGNAPVFSQSTDALHFRNACDSLKTVYPDSRYVAALEKETVRRENILKLENELKNASRSGFPDLNIPDIKGKPSKLSDVKSKAILLHFWNSADAAQNMFAKEILLPIYEDYHKKGLEIYSVCLDTDKARWASVVNGQNLPWINVNDGLGAASPSIRLYNLSTLPATILIADDSISASGIQGEAGLRKELSRLLK